ncbi:MAG: DUF421 domain-containing protein [Oscillospiraceae bacterium]|nr:DUF421 domain-containing protein [Oscillospiraceae bacterium]
MDYLKTLLCALLSIGALFGFSRLLGRRQIAQMSFFDYVNGITIGSVSAELAVCRGEGWQHMLLAMAVYTAVVAAVSLGCNRWIALRRFVEGKPIILMERGKLHERNLAAARLDINELLTMARCEGYYDLSQLEAAVWETNGKVSFLPKSEHRPLTPQDASLPVEAASLCAVVVSDGEVMAQCLQSAGYDVQWLQKQLAALGLRTADVMLATVDGQGSFTAFAKTGERYVRHVFL